MVDDCTESEAYRLLLHQLPREWVRKIKKEEAKRFGHEEWVQIANLPDLTAAEMKKILNHMGFDILAAKRVHNTFRVLCSCIEERKRMVRVVDRCQLDGKCLKLRHCKREMSVEEIFDFVSAKLRVEEDAMAWEVRRRAENTHGDHRDQGGEGEGKQ